MTPTEGIPMRPLWKIKPQDFELSNSLARDTKISHTLAQVLANRGITNSTDARKYLYPVPDDISPPFELPDMEKAVNRIFKAKRNGEPIVIYGDYDTDGTTAVSLLMSVFKELDIQARYYIPDRFNEGYGLNKNAIQAIKKAGCDLLITVDCGITSTEEVRFAKNLGIDVIITDHHHMLGEDLPDVYAIITDNLSGVGLAFRLAHGLMNDDRILRQLDLVCLGTIVDMVNLDMKNRILTRLGLLEMAKRKRPGIAALCDIAGLGVDKDINGRTLGFVLGPRVNAAGRMGSASKVVELFTTESEKEAQELSIQLNTANQERQKVGKHVYNEASELASQYREDNGLVIAQEGWHKGVIGIAATKIMLDYCRPTFLLTIEEDIAYGSGRSVDDFDLVECLNGAKDLLISYGGHKAAAGIRLKKDNIDKFRDFFNQSIPEGLEAYPTIDIDVDVPVLPVTPKDIRQMNVLEPFGQGNKMPMVLLKEMEFMYDLSTMGSSGQHIKLHVTDGVDTIDAVGWGMGKYETVLKGDNICVDLIGELQVNNYGGQSSQLIIRDMKRRIS